MNINININEQLFDAVCYNNLTRIRELITSGADVNYHNNVGDTPLHCVKSSEIAQLLVLNGADVNCRNDNGNTPLHRARTIEILQFLIINGANINCCNNNGITPLHFFCLNYFFFVPNDILLKYMKTLLDNGADMHIKDNENKSAYDKVIKSIDKELIKLFEHYNAISNGLEIKEPCVE